MTPRLAPYRLLKWAALAGASVGLALFCVRFLSTISFFDPLQFQTSGDESASLFAVWKWTQSEPIYADRHTVPFAAALFNWLFYIAYGSVVQVLQQIFQLNDAWQPTLGRLFTVVGTIVTGLAGYNAFRHADVQHRLPIAAYACLLAVGPLVGFWSLTVRPDIWSMAFEVTAIAVYLRWSARRKWAAVIFAAACAYLAWSFKQGSVFAAGAIGFLLLMRHDWRCLFGFSSILIAAWAATFLVGSPAYKETVLFSDYPLFFSVERGLRNVANLAIKTGPFWVPVLILPVILLRDSAMRRDLWANDAFVLGLGGVLAGAAIAVPLSLQTGGSENYFFSLSFFLALLAVTALVQRHGVDGGHPGHGGNVLLTFASIGGWVSVTLATAAVIVGLTGVVSLRATHEALVLDKACLDKMPRPLFVHDRYLSLPWMTPGTTPFVLAYVYEVERRAGVHFERGGVGGMIQDGDFRTIVIHGDADIQELDSADLGGYVLKPGLCPTLSVYRRKIDP